MESSTYECACGAMTQSGADAEHYILTCQSCGGAMIAYAHAPDDVDPLEESLNLVQSPGYSRPECAHPNARNLYEQRPPSEGRQLVPMARRCPDCGDLLEYPRNIEHLRELMIKNHPLTVDARGDWHGDQVTFGGPEPPNTVAIWSWDENRILTGTYAGDLEIIDRPEKCSCSRTTYDTRHEGEYVILVHRAECTAGLGGHDVASE